MKKTSNVKRPAGLAAAIGSPSKPPMTFQNHSWSGPETETVLAIEYHPCDDGKLRPFQVFTDQGGYDFEYCRRDDAIY